MTLPYIPGWWDSISQNATKFVSQLPERIQPDNVANRRLQEMVRQNPDILNQLGNMDEGTRKLFEQSIGYRNQAPISALPVGAERQMREMKQGAMNRVMATPEGAAEIDASLTGTLTPTQRKKDYLAIKGQEVGIKGAEQSIDINALNKELLTGKVKDMQRAQSQIDAAIAKYPDLSQVNYKSIVRDFVRRGQPIDPALMTASINDEGAKSLLELGIKTELMALENEYSMRLRTAKDPNTSMLLLRTLTEQANQIETTQQRLLGQRQLIQSELDKDRSYTILKIKANNGDKAAQEQLVVREAPLKQIDQALNTYMQAGVDIQQRTEKYGEMLGLPKTQKQKITDPTVFMQQWMSMNPQQVGETPQAYAARGRAAFNAQ